MREAFAKAIAWQGRRGSIVGVGVGEAVGGVGRALKIPFTARVKSSMIREPVYPVRSAVIAWSI